MLELQLPDMRCRYSSWRSNSSRSGTGGELLRRFMDEEASRPSNWFFQLRIWQSSWFLRHATRPKHSLKLNPESVPWVPVRTSFLANNTFVLTKALVAGRGLGGAQLPQIDAELADGSLVQIMPDYEYAPLEVHAVVPTSQFVPAKVRAFMDYLKTAVGKII